MIEISDKSSKPGTESWSKACTKVIGALEEYGCFVALYDKITHEIHNGVFNAMKELFDLPTRTKVQNKSSKPLYGYVGQIPLIPLYESMGIDNANTLQGIHNFTKVMWPNDANHGFSEKLFSYTKLAAELEKTVVQMVFEGYGVGKYYESHIGSANYLCRVMKYREPKANENKMGFVSHTDKSFMSTIHQNRVDGLEIKAKDGEWFAVRELSHSSVVVMAGDAIMAWSNNRIKSPHHRVTMEGNEARYSIAQFSFMDNLTVQTPPELVDEEHPLQYKPFDHLEFLEFYSREENRKLESAIKTYCGV
ncbi:2-oxoglutarate (2OG) and Fe(II)-dependent oxygenase superfamily protein [Striga hermonthica]|uniref:2-oxoglutarate (2OG) and Fe(II)-dependent oxygenase superfamily protein n=1 Tax=Striga hermonthica TaxID=68872 RepID=A0A9N7RQ05_STRHE|nr:2-oxoglutarate (2OG) and Fe(II)-dependent oxygenase superfamily protein [Striga hermonthica]